jgi:YD repeat-containing protein
VQVTDYRSTDEFVDEVKSIPPRTLSLRTTATGGLVFTRTNSYDAQRRLTGFTNTAAGETITTTYTTWDNAGRPTAGAQSNAGTISISYNDAGRSQTTVIFGLGNEVATFDLNGNPLTSVRDTGVGPVTTTTTIASTANVCK